MEASSVREDPFNEFDPKVRQDVDGLVYLGALSQEVEFCGHHFGLRTLRAGEEIAAGVAVQEYRNTLKEAEAWATVQVGLALTHVDGEEDFCPQAGPDLAAFARARFNYMGRWFPPTTTFLYYEYTKLLQRQLDAVQAVQDFLNRGLHTFSPSVDSFSARGISSDAINSGTLS